MSTRLNTCAIAAFLTIASSTQSPQPLSLAPDSPRWDLQGQAKATAYLGRPCLSVDGGAAALKDFEMRDGVIDADVAVAASAPRGFFGFLFRMTSDGAQGE